MSYCTAANFLQFYDARSTGNLVSDTSVPVSPTALLTNTTLQACLDAAAGMINAAILVAQKYTVAELQALTGVDAQYLNRLNADLAFGILNSRRGNDANAFPNYKSALGILDELRSGNRVFNFSGAVSSALPALGFPPLNVYAQLGLIVDSTKSTAIRRQQQPNL
jgi:hypothetical protein